MSPRILVVDDEPSLVRGLTYALERDKFEVEVATDGEAAVDAALTQAVDLVILDLMLPKLSGEEACRQIRSRSDVPIIMLTAKDSERDLLTGLEIGADDYVTKPFSAAELIGRVGALLRRRALDQARTRSSSARSARSRSTSSATRCRSTGSRSSLTPSEFKILGSPGRRSRRRLHAAADHGAPLGKHVHRRRAHLRGARLGATPEDRARSVFTRAARHRARRRLCAQASLTRYPYRVEQTSGRVGEKNSGRDSSTISITTGG